MRAALTSLVVVCLAACGAPPGQVPLGIDLATQALTGDEAVQLVLLQPTDRSGEPVTCADATVTCVRDQLNKLRLVTLELWGGEQAWYRAPIDPDAASSAEGQPLTVPGIPPGRGYLLVVELVQTSNTGDQRTGVGCTVIEEIVGGNNPPVQVTVTETEDSCNARF